MAGAERAQARSVTAICVGSSAWFDSLGKRFFSASVALKQNSSELRPVTAETVTNSNFRLKLLTDKNGKNRGNQTLPINPDQT